MQIINFIYFWRFEKEKWFDLILNIIEFFQHYKNVNFFIFWNWSLEKNIFYIKSSNVIFFWRKDKDFIDKYLQKSHYCLMPSRFLETFWLVALESLQKWVPVIWFWKWGLKSFIQSDLDILNYQWKDEKEKLINTLLTVIEKFNIKDWKKQSNLCKQISEKYTIDNWLNSFLSKINTLNKKKILIVSDFLPKIWWIENYINNVKNILIQNWFEVELFWFNWSNWVIKKSHRIFWLFYSCFNFYYYFKLKKKLKLYNPDVIWFHSILRFLWWMPLLSILWFKWEKRIMYHDLWYFHPYPSRVFEINQVNFEFNLNNFLKAWNTKNPIKLILIILKFLSILIIKSRIKKNIDKNIIPSIYMKQILEKNYGIPENKIFCLNHFII